MAHLPYITRLVYARVDTVSSYGQLIAQSMLSLTLNYVQGSFRQIVYKLKSWTKLCGHLSQST